MKKSQIILAIILMTSTFNIHTSNIIDKSSCPLAKKSFDRLSDNGVTNMEHGWNKITRAEKKSIPQFLSTRPYEIGVQKIVCGSAQILYGTGQVAVGETIKLTMQHPDKALITIVSIGSFLYTGR